MAPLRLTQACRLADRHKKEVALLFLDLNRFKQVNDNLGHEKGGGPTVARGLLATAKLSP